MVADTQSNVTEEVENIEKNQPREAIPTRANGNKSMRIPKVPDNQQNPLIAELLEICHLQSEQIQALKPIFTTCTGQAIINAQINKIFLDVPNPGSWQSV